jgi:hypothetical protein
LLPHHEHIVPPPPTTQDKERLIQEVAEADGVPKTVQAEQRLEQAEKDEANVKMSVHASLPAYFDQQLLDFVATLVKATKFQEVEKETKEMEGECNGCKFLRFSQTCIGVTRVSSPRPPPVSGRLQGQKPADITKTQVSSESINFRYIDPTHRV